MDRESVGKLAATVKRTRVDEAVAILLVLILASAVCMMVFGMEQKPIDSA